MKTRQDQSRISPLDGEAGKTPTVSTANSVAAAGAALGSMASLALLTFPLGGVVGAVIGLAAGKLIGEVIDSD